MNINLKTAYATKPSVAVGEPKRRGMTVVMGTHGFETRSQVTKPPGRKLNLKHSHGSLVDESDKVGRRREDCRSCRPGRLCANIELPE